MTTQQITTAPSGWKGSVPEYMVYNSLITTFNLDPITDFSFQSEYLGGRLDKGGLILDFVFENPPDLAINVQGEYYHYGKGKVITQNDMLTREQIASMGINLIFIDESDVLKDVDYYVKEALNYKDHSKLGGGI